MESAPSSNSHRTHATESGLLRFFQWELFDVSYAVTYLFKSKEPGVLQYIVNKLFDFQKESVDFYLPQFINMFVQIPEVAEALHPYLVARCRDSVEFSLECAWLLDAYAPPPSGFATKKRSHGNKLKNLILHDELR
jgi:phosphatidylinositol 4-kinase